MGRGCEFNLSCPKDSWVRDAQHTASCSNRQSTHQGMTTCDRGHQGMTTCDRGADGRISCLCSGSSLCPLLRLQSNKLSIMLIRGISHSLKGPGECHTVAIIGHKTHTATIASSSK